MSTSPVSSASGVVGLVQGAIHDTTGLNVLTKTLQKSQEALAQSAQVQQSVRQAQGIGTKIDVSA